MGNCCKSSRAGADGSSSDPDDFDRGAYAYNPEQYPDEEEEWFDERQDDIERAEWERAEWERADRERGLTPLNPALHNAIMRRQNSSSPPGKSPVKYHSSTGVGPSGPGASRHYPPPGASLKTEKKLTDIEEETEEELEDEEMDTFEDPDYLEQMYSLGNRKPKRIHRHHLPSASDKRKNTRGLWSRAQKKNLQKK